MAKATGTPVGLEEQFKHVTYDMLILAMSLRYINESWPKQFENSMVWTEGGCQGCGARQNPVFGLLPVWAML